MTERMCVGHVQVRMLIGLIRKVTGVTISAFFKDKTGYKYSGREMEMPWHNRSGFGHNIRKYRMRSAIQFIHFYRTVWGVDFISCVTFQSGVWSQL